MATVDLTELWLHTASDLSDYLLLEQDNENAPYSTPGDRRLYAGGVLRAVTTPGTAEDVNVFCSYVSTEDYENLKTRVGIPQMLRDQRGRVLFGIIFSLDPTDLVVIDGVSVSFTFQQITMTNEV